MQEITAVTMATDKMIPMTVTKDRDLFFFKVFKVNRAMIFML